MSKRVEGEDVNHIQKAIEDLETTRRSKAKTTIGFRCDPDLKAEAEREFGNALGKVLEAALRQAMAEKRKRVG